MPTKRGYYQKKMRELRDAFGGKCQWDDCDSTIALEFAHMKPTDLKGRGRGQAVRYHNIKKNPEAYMLVCRPCHAEMDDLNPDFHNYSYEAGLLEAS